MEQRAFFELTRRFITSELEDFSIYQQHKGTKASYNVHINTMS